MTNVFLALVAAGAGAAGVIQAAANAGLSARIGLASALVVNTTLVLLCALVFWAIRGAQLDWFPPGTPASLYVGGLCGFAILLSLAFVFPKIGAAVAIALVVLGQGAAALAIDHYGWMGMPLQPVTVARIAGMLLVGAGVVLIRG